MTARATPATLIAKMLGVLCLAAAVLAAPARAEDSKTLGWGRLFTNDALGDGQDRWRTGAYTVSRLAGPRWSGELPSVFGSVLEYRFSAETIAPSNLVTGAPDDRRYAGALSFGAASHSDLRGFDAMLGAGFTAIGPSTGLGQFQSLAHEIFGLAQPGVLDNQIPDQIRLYGTAELARPLSLGTNLTLRPFVAAQFGAEDLARLGGDVILGRLGQRDLLLRDGPTGQLHRGIKGDDDPQISLVLGGDLARVFDSAYLPDGETVVMTPNRQRLRGGLLVQGRFVSIFSGLTYLSPEFDGQPEGQVLGSLTASMNF